MIPNAFKIAALFPRARRMLYQSSNAKATKSPLRTGGIYTFASEMEATVDAPRTTAAKTFRRRSSDRSRRTSPSFSPPDVGLHFKRVGKRRPVYSVRVSRNYRALGVLQDGDVVWLWIGPHDQYGTIHLWR